MALSDLQVFQDYVYDTYQPLLDYNFNMFNEKTMGGLVLVPGSMRGDFSTEALWNRITNLVIRRNPYGTGSLTAKQLGMSLSSKVKVGAGMNPVDISPAYFEWIKKSPEEAGTIVGRQLAEDTIADMLNVAAISYIGALTQVGATVVNDATAGNLTLGAMLSGAALFGDQSQNIQCWLIHSKPAFDIWGANLANSAQLFKFGTVKILDDGFGRPIVMADVPALQYVATGTKYHTLGLSNAGVVIEQNPDFTSNIETSNGGINILRTMQAEWSYNVTVRGYTWDTVNGGKAPTDAALGTSTNWDRVSQIPLKLTAGVMVNSQ